MIRAIRSQTIAWAVLVAFATLITLPVNGDARPPRRRNKAKTGTVTIFSLIKGAIVEINGKQAGTIPLKSPLKLPAGKYSVHVYKRGHTDFDETITVVAGEILDVEAELIPFAGVVTIQGNIPGATVAVDGKFVGTIPLDKDIAAGKREITVQADGHIAFRQLVDIAPGKPLQLNVFLKPISLGDLADTDEESIVKKWWFWTIIGAVVAGGATTTVLLIPGPKKVNADYDGQPIFY
jgi:hypothetical protein